ncbi:MAG: RrF2 family transcriptional regulator [Deltaproteobacteria bacterium]|nr:RrF2 family transcriptional regulator [Deltaproteobacteria bacterium]
MKLSTRGEYGLRAMLYLAMKQTSGDDLLQASEISEAQDIPPHYLKQILSRLRAAGLVRSARGPTGGHGLGRDPAQITVGEVIQCLEGQLTNINAILDLPCHIKVGPQHCVIKEFLVEVKQEIEGILHRKTIAELAGRQRVLSDNKIIVQPRIMRPPGAR